jgi:hypothetical protein
LSACRSRAISAEYSFVDVIIVLFEYIEYHLICRRFAAGTFHGFYTAIAAAS